jgi:hypothetical protein
MYVRSAEFGIRHDGGWIRIHQDHLVTFLTKRLACLCAGIIEFAGLPDDDRTGSDDKNFVNIGTFRHERAPVCSLAGAAQR